MMSAGVRHTCEEVHSPLTQHPAACAADVSGPSAREDMVGGTTQVHEDSGWYLSRESTPAHLKQRVELVAWD